MPKKNRRVPEVLWRLFHNRARTLAETILSLIPPPPTTAAGCRCKGRRCLSCSGNDAMSFLLRPNDPPDYRKLLTKCFVVVSEIAPSMPIFDPECRWPQLENQLMKGNVNLGEVPLGQNLSNLRRLGIVIQIWWDLFRHYYHNLKDFWKSKECDWAETIDFETGQKGEGHVW